MDETIRLLSIKRGFVVVLHVTDLYYTSERCMYTRIHWMYYRSM